MGIIFYWKNRHGEKETYVLYVNFSKETYYNSVVKNLHDFACKYDEVALFPAYEMYSKKEIIKMKNYFDCNMCYTFDRKIRERKCI